jgi:hypothetical protein
MSDAPETTPSRRLELAYAAVFGLEAGRTPDQSLVWRDIESFCRAYRLSAETNNLNNVDDKKTYINEGRRSFWLRARGQIQLAQQPPRAISVNRKPQKP